MKKVSQCESVPPERREGGCYDYKSNLCRGVCDFRYRVKAVKFVAVEALKKAK